MMDSRQNAIDGWVRPLSHCERLISMADFRIPIYYRRWINLLVLDLLSLADHYARIELDRDIKELSDMDFVEKYAVKMGDS